MENESLNKTLTANMINYEFVAAEHAKNRLSEQIAAIENGNAFHIPRRFISAKISDFKEKYDCAYNESLFIQGACGTGKTHLAVAIAKGLYLKRIRESQKEMDISPDIFYNFQEIAIKVKSSFRTQDESMFDVIRPCLTRFKIIDDIGAAKPTETTIEALYLVVNTRYDDCLPTIYTSNLTLKEMSGSYGDRIASRLAACTQIKLVGADRRIIQAPEK